MRRLRGLLTRSSVVLVVVISVLGGPAAAPGPAAESPATRAGGDPVGTWPLDPRPPVVRGFEPPPHPYAAGHRGVDLAGRVGQPVRAALPGTVTFAGSLAGRGVVVVDHGATRTTYQPVAAGVGVGAAVAAGGRIGVLQAGPSHCAPRACLHWGWIEDSTYLDPLRLVGAGPVRLLPWAGLVAPVGPAAGPLGSPGYPPPLLGLAQALGWAWR